MSVSSFFLPVDISHQSVELRGRESSKDFLRFAFAVDLCILLPIHSYTQHLRPAQNSFGVKLEQIWRTQFFLEIFFPTFNWPN